MVHRAKIRNYKSLRDIDVELRPLTVLFGPNAAGKSNFIDALQLLSRIAVSRSLKEAFEPPYRGKPLESFSFGAGGMEGLLALESASFTIEVDIELSATSVAAAEKEIREMKRGSGGGNGRAPKPNVIHHQRLRYRIEVGISPQTGILRVEDEFLAPLGRNGEPRKSPRPFLERVGGRMHLRMEGQSHPIYFDRFMDHSILSRPHYPPHYPHLTALRKEIESWFFYYFEPRERMRAATSVKEIRHIGLMGEELAAFLHTLKTLDEKQFRAVERSIHNIIPAVTGIRTEVNKAGEVELSVLEGAVAMPARVVSEGTLRLLGLLALGGVKEPPALIGFEEPENGVHPRRVRDIAKLLSARAETGATQIIVTTHSPVLPDHLDPHSLFVCRKTAAGTAIEALEPWGPLSIPSAIEDALADEEPDLTVSERILRGDFDA
ncbi:MAG: AAA family ATPase [Bryobacteraceae bacterium]